LKEITLAHRIDEKECLKCGVCVPKCPEGAINDVVTYSEGLEIHNTSIDPDKCNDCGVCEQTGDAGYFCPAEAIVRA
jgi:ferredoxin